MIVQGEMIILTSGCQDPALFERQLCCEKWDGISSCNIVGQLCSAVEVGARSGEPSIPHLVIRMIWAASDLVILYLRSTQLGAVTGPHTVISGSDRAVSAFQFWIPKVTAEHSPASLGGRGRRRLALQPSAGRSWSGCWSLSEGFSWCCGLVGLLLLYTSSR